MESTQNSYSSSPHSCIPPTGDRPYHYRYRNEHQQSSLAADQSDSHFAGTNQQQVSLVDWPNYYTPPLSAQCSEQHSSGPSGPCLSGPLTWAPPVQGAAVEQPCYTLQAPRQPLCASLAMYGTYSSPGPTTNAQRYSSYITHPGAGPAHTHPTLWPPSSSAVTLPADPVASITTGLGQLHLLPNRRPSREQAVGPSALNLSPRLLDRQIAATRWSSVDFTGSPSEERHDCPEWRVVTYSSIWYYHKDNDKFLICTKCYHDHINRSPFASEFIRYEKPAGKATKCYFNVTRMLQTEWPHALATGSLNNFMEFVHYRSIITDCRGTGGATAEDGVKWFAPVDGQPEGFVICQACHEEKVVGTNFDLKFRPSPKFQAAGETWACDLATLRIDHAYTAYCPDNDWQSFSQSIADRIALPTCENKLVRGNTRRWYRPRREIYDMGICETCYQDRIALTPFGNEFVELLESEIGDEYLCDMPQIPMLVAMDIAQRKQDFNIWWNAANAIMQAPRCSGKGIREGTWYTIAGGHDNFDLCGACYAGLILTRIPEYSVHQFIQLAKRDPNATIICDMNPASPRFQRYATKLDEALDKRSFSLLTDYILKFAALPLCPKMVPEEGLTWYGFHACKICPDCYFDVIEHTPLAAQMQLQGSTDPRPLTCDMYSPRIRQLWMQACRTGNTANLLAFATHRRRVYQNTMPEVQGLREKMRQKDALAAMNGYLSNRYNSMDAMNSMMGGGSGYGVWQGKQFYHSYTAAESARYRELMRQGFLEASDPQTKLRIAELEKQWREVE